jgi:lipoprotein signal peptidase
MPLPSRTETLFLGFFLWVALADFFLRPTLGVLPESLCNPGVGLGLVVPGAVLWPVLAMLGAAVSIRFWRARDLRERLAWGLILCGGLANGADRVFRGCVTDYLHLPFFPSFNGADMMLFLGALWILATALGFFSSANEV